MFDCSPLMTQDARRPGPGDLKDLCNPLYSKPRSGKLPYSALLSVALRLLYHGPYDCGEIRRNHGYRGSIGSFWEGVRAASSARGRV